MALVEAGVVLQVTIGFGVLVFLGGLQGYVTAGSKMSLIMSTMCAVVEVGLALAGLWAVCGVWSIVLFAFFLKGLMGIKKGDGPKTGSGCVMSAGAETVPEGEGSWNKHIRSAGTKAEPLLPEQAERMEKIAKYKKATFIVLVLFALVEVFLCFQLLLA